MNTLVGAAPLIGTGSLDGFAIGALVSGACFLAITSPRRTRRRPADVARAGRAPLTAARSSWLREHVMATEHRMVALPRIAGGHVAAGEHRLAGEHRMAGEHRLTGEPRMAGEHPMADGADEERLALPEELGGHGTGLLANGRGSRAAGYRSRHRLGDPIPGSSAPGGAPRDGMLPGGAHRDSVLPDVVSPDRPSEDDAPRKNRPPAFPDSAFPGRVFPDSAFPDSAFPDSAFPGKAFPDIASGNGALPDVAFPDGSFGSTRRPEVRRMPRHAAPTVSFAARMTGLFASRALLSGARG